MRRIKQLIGRLFQKFELNTERPPLLLYQSEPDTERLPNLDRNVTVPKFTVPKRNIFPENIEPALEEIVGGKYKLKREIYRSLGVLFEAEDVETSQQMAIKGHNFLKYSEPDFYQRFLNEIYILGKLEHENIVKTYPSFLYKDCRYLPMEFVENELDHFFEENGVLKKPDDFFSAVYDFIYQMARALDLLREKEIVHRDIKPENILVAKDSIIKLIDFGIAQDKTSPFKVEDEPEVIIGSFGYIPPERTYGLKKERSSSDRYAIDMYCFGATLLKITKGYLGAGEKGGKLKLTDTFPCLEDVSTGAFIEKSLDELYSKVPTKLTEIIAGCTMLKPGRRIKPKELMEKVSSLI